MRSTAFFSASAAALANLVAAKDGRSFAVMHFYGDGPLMEGRVDPIVQPGGPSGHVHTVMGGSNFGFNATGEDLARSSCTNALVKGDMSAYWVPKLYFHDQDTNTFEPVDMFYMNVYYFFEGTNDEIKAFPLGLQMVSGNANLRVAPASGGDTKLTPDDPQPASWTCPRSSFDPPSWPPNSDGSTAGMQSKNNKGEGVGFPFANCDGYASPLRADLHFPSCYNPAAGLTNYKSNMAFPTSVSNGKQDCPEGWIHVPHIFYEVYWNTPKFKDRWTPFQNSQPFVLSNGDRTGFSMHGDFMAAWDENILQHIIDTCDAGDRGMDNCAGVEINDKNAKCNIQSPVNEEVTAKLSSLPGNNPLAGWGVGNVNVAPVPSNPAPPAPNPAPASSKTAPVPAPPASNPASGPSNSAPSSGAGSGSGSNNDYGGGGYNSGSGSGSSSGSSSGSAQENQGNPAPSLDAKPAVNQASPLPAVTQPAPQNNGPQPVATKVVQTTDAAGQPTLVTVYETVTAWTTVYVYERDAPSPTPDVNNKRHLHNHMVHHRGRFAPRK